jgi:hypothetical protein
MTSGCSDTEFMCPFQEFVSSRNLTVSGISVLESVV